MKPDKTLITCCEERQKAKANQRIKNLL